ncbi:MAG: sensor histidine kinase [Blastocatellia bacterium]
MFPLLVYLLARSFDVRRIFRSTPSLALLCLALAPSGAFAQYRFDVWTTDNGLPQNVVYDITQTRDGYLWFTTLDGLVRYDGVRFTVFNKNNSSGLNSNRLTCLYEDAEGALWIGAEDSGVIRYARGVFTTFTTKDGLPDNQVIGIQPDDAGGLQIVTLGGFAFWRRNRIEPDPDKTDRYKVRRYFAPSGAIWTLDQTGLSRFKDGRTTLYPPLIKPNEIHIASFYEDRQGNLWLGATTTTIFKIKDGAVTRYSERDGLPVEARLEAIYEDRNGAIWIGTVGRGLIHLKDGRITVYTKQDGLSHNDVRDVFEDREGNIWVGTNGGGVNRLRRQFITTYSTQNGLYDDNVYPIYQDRAGAVWVGAGGSLSRFADGKIINYTEKDVLGHRFNVQSLCEDSEGRIWAGSYGGLGWLKDGKFTVAPDIFPSGAVYAIHEDRGGNLWIGAQNGLVKFKDGARNVYTTAHGLPGNDVKVIHEDRQGNLWIGTYGGLARLTDGKFTSFTEQNGLASNRVRCIYEDADGTFWIGTYDGGLSRLKDGGFTNYTEKNGLYNNGVFQILEDARGVFWMSCNKGIYRVSRRQLNDYADGKISAIICAAYGKQDGMLSSECNGGRQPGGIAARDGKLWFPTQGGVVVIDPDAAPRNPLPPPVKIESVVLDKSAVDFRDQVRVTPDQKYLEISYTGLSFIKSEQTQFKYKLVGQDADWNDAGTRRVAYYSYLPPGSYTFTVTAANSDGVWNTDGASLRIVVAPPFWRTWWFLSLTSLTLAGAVFLAYRRRVAHLQEARAAQEAFSRQLLDSQERERQRIAAELHDSLGQSLLIIKNRAFLALGAIEDREVAKEQLEEISTATSHAIEEVREIAYNLRPYQIDRFGLTRTLRAIFTNASGASGVNFSAEVEPIDGLFPSATETGIYRIVQESVNNIIKHSRATDAKLAIHRNGQEVQLVIQDNGQGFVKSSGPLWPVRANTGELGRGGFGLLGMAERVRLMGGAYSMDSAPGKGMTITIKLAIPTDGYEQRDSNPDRR